MQRFLLCGFFLLLLPACGRGTALPPAEVLERAVSVGSALSAARVHANVEAMRHRPSPVSAVGVFDGALRGGGRLIRGAMQVHIRPSGSQEILFDGDIAMEWGKHVFVLPRRMQPVQEDGAMATGRWYQLNLSGQDDGSITPDPQLLRAQAAVIKVTNDYGLEEQNGRNVYHYDVALDQGKLLSLQRQLASLNGEEFDEAAEKKLSQTIDATGELWIDARTFVLHRIRWSVRQGAGEKADTLTVDITLMDHDHDITVSVPAQGLPFPTNAMLPLLAPFLLPAS